MATSCPATTAGATTSFWGTLIWLTLASIGLLLVTEAARAAPCWGVALLATGLAFPLWLSWRESFLFSRRALLAGAIPAHCAARRWFWNGRFGSVLLVGLALGLALLLLAFGLRLNGHQWAILFADALLLALLQPLMRRLVARQIHPHLLGIAVRGWPLRWANLLLLALAFFVLSFFLLGAPDLRQSSWHAAVEQSFQAGLHAAACPGLGGLIGCLEAYEVGSWALAQHLIPRLPAPEWRLAAWGLFLLQYGLLALLYTRLLLGVLTLVETRRLRAETLKEDSTLAKTFILTILVLAMFSLYPVLRLRDFEPSQLAAPVREVLTWVDPCHDTLDQNAQIRIALDSRLAADRERLSAEAGQGIAMEVEGLFAPVEAAVDTYLDWYFTVVGEYERLAALVVGDFPQLMGAQLDAHLFAATDFPARLETLDRNLFDGTLARLSGVSQDFKVQIEAQVAADPCARATLNWPLLASLERDVWRASVAGTSGATVGLATSFALSQKVVASVVAKVGTKKSVQAAAAMAAKLAAKKGGGALAAAAGATAVCLPTGPWAIACGLTAGAVTWLAVDKIAIEVDETLSRDDMRAEIFVVLAENKEQLKNALIQRQTALIGYLIGTIETTVDGVFIPARDGW